MYNMSEGFERVKRRNKESVMYAALDLFKAHGIKKVSMHDVANKAGVSPATIYNHFENKQDLVDQVIQMQLENLVEGFTAEITADKPYLERLEQLLFNEDQFMTGVSGHMGNETIFQELQTKPLNNFPWYAQSRKHLENFVNEGKQLGYIKKEIKTKNMLILLEIIWRGIISVSYGEKLVKRKDIISQLIDYFFINPGSPMDSPAVNQS